ncbi:LacI family DNA-binding transcriptional regulator [Jannaschia sp. R86511]|uniref:LacI family DNA-binding transcriptional regulator n=1 Tax=Jannaschia sp. R86511 TaxID=3093853 RepID=UPI0036D3B6E0
MADVARAAGVSAMTVSYAFGQPERVSAESTEKVRRAAAELGYTGPQPVARSLRRGRTATIGVVLGEHLTYAFDDPQAARFLAGVAQVCADEAVGLTLVPVSGARDDTSRVAQAAVDGFVVWTTSDDDPVLAAVAATGRPAVVHGGPAGGRLPSIGIDDREAARAIGRVVFAGARRPAVLSFPLDRARRSQVIHGPDPDVAAFPVTRNRLAGFRDAWEARGGSWSDVRVIVCSRNKARLGAEAVPRMLGDGADAVAAMSDELALGALGAARQLGVPVPATLAVSGWDDADAAAPAGLSTVRQDLRDQGVRCARIAMGQPDLEEAPHWEIVARSTTPT